MDTTGNRKIYDAPRAVAAVLTGSGLDPQTERAKLDRARTATQEFALAVKRGEWVAADEMDRVLVTAAGLTGARLRGVGARLAAELAAAGGDRAHCPALVDDAIAGALSGLVDEAETAMARLQAGQDVDQVAAASGP